MKILFLTFTFLLIATSCFAESPNPNSFDTLFEWGEAIAGLGIVIGLGVWYFIPNAPNVAPWNLPLGENIALLSFLGVIGLALLKGVLSLLVSAF